MKLKGRSYESLYNADGETVISLNRAVSLCAKRAEALYYCRISLECPMVPEFLVNESFRKTAEEICDTLDKFCRNEDSVSVKLIREHEKTASFCIYSEDDRLLFKKEYLLYTGTPKYVVKEDSKENELTKEIDEIFGLLEKMYKQNIR